MNWREKLFLLLGANPWFISGSALASTAPIIRQADTGAEVQRDQLIFADPAQRDRMILLAGHRSHSSHSSHRSHYSSSSGHSSHYSGTIYSAPPSPKPAPRKTTPAPQSFYSPSDTNGAKSQSDKPSVKKYNQAELVDIIQKVQIALIVRGYDPGPVDGHLGAKTKAALSKFQADNALEITGLMDLQTLRLLNVVP